MKTAWYIDDDQDMIQAISLMMGLLDFEVKPFLNARTAAGELQFSQPDLLILDVNMPEVSGIDMLEFVRRKPELNHLPIVMLSSEHTDAQQKPVKEFLTVLRRLEAGQRIHNHGYEKRSVHIRVFKQCAYPAVFYELLAGAHQLKEADYASSDGDECGDYIGAPQDLEGPGRVLIYKANEQQA